MNVFLNSQRLMLDGMHPTLLIATRCSLAADRRKRQCCFFFPFFLLSGSSLSNCTCPNIVSGAICLYAEKKTGKGIRMSAPHLSSPVLMVSWGPRVDAAQPYSHYD